MAIPPSQKGRADVLERMLLLLDGSSLAESVLPHAVPLAQRFDSTLVLLRALTRGQSGMAAEALDAVGWQMDIPEAPAYLESICDRLQQLDVQAEQGEGLGSQRLLLRQSSGRSAA
jgi:nucleotide-binding universal stress UspA family protein